MSSISVLRPRKSRVLTALMSLYLIYTLLPLVWLVISASKTQPDLLSTPGLSFGGQFALFDNIVETFTYNNGIFFRWLGNTLLYVVAGAGGATLLATAAGYGLAKYDFAGRKAVFAVILGAIAIPARHWPCRPSCCSATSG
jgi:multiple sugar transport system permease protein